jgi:hypothetical protein
VRGRLHPRPRIGNPASWTITDHAIRRVREHLRAPSRDAAVRRLRALLGASPRLIDGDWLSARFEVLTSRGALIVACNMLDRRVTTCWLRACRTPAGERIPAGVPGAGGG